jgi:hypothetical protein
MRSGGASGKGFRKASNYKGMLLKVKEIVKRAMLNGAGSSMCLE